MTVQGKRCRGQGVKREGLGRKRYRLAQGTQVREEDFGLLFYTMKGPRLFFLKCGCLLAPGFFRGEVSLEWWMGDRRMSGNERSGLEHSLASLEKKGVIREC